MFNENNQNINNQTLENDNVIYNDPDLEVDITIEELHM